MKKLGNFELDNVYCGDSKELMEDVPSNKVDLIVTDPPYGYSFMGKDWDKAIMPVPYWKECFRVLKPGAFIFVMSSPRQDVLMRAIGNLEKAGFNTGFSSIYWTYASGFPKATNISLAIDKRECKKQLIEKLGRKSTKKEFEKEWEGFRKIFGNKIYGDGKEFPQTGKRKCFNRLHSKKYSKLTVPTTPQAQELEGSYGGFQPKPAVEVIIVAMKPLSEKTYVDQALKNRKGITWLDDCKIPYKSEEEKEKAIKMQDKPSQDIRANSYNKPGIPNRDVNVRGDYSKGRFPANLLVSDDVLNDGKIRKSGFGNGRPNLQKGGTKNQWVGGNKSNIYTPSDSGSFSRYFDLDKWAVSKGVKDTFPFLIVPKASKSEKNRGCEKLKGKIIDRCEPRPNETGWRKERMGKVFRKNTHPTVKPIKLMSYLITLGSREGDIIVDNFCGSGSTLVSAKELNRSFLGFDTEMEYVEISRARLSAVKQIQEKLL